MIVPFPGVAFTEAADGDVRGDPMARGRVASRLGIGAAWATVDQVHGSVVREARSPGAQGEADALFTRRSGLPLAVFTADCLGIAFLARGGVGVAHAGWRGLDAGVLESLRDAMCAAGVEPERAVAGPAIGECCYEVGPEVRARFPGFETVTRWGTASVDLAAAAEARLGLSLERHGGCTGHDSSWYSHRRDRTTARMAVIVWRQGE